MHNPGAHRGLAALFIRMLLRLSRASIRHPVKALMVGTAIVLAAAPGVWRLKLRTDGRSLISKDAPEFVYDQEVRRRFGIRDQLIVLVRASDEIFNPETLQLVRDLSAELGNLPGVGSTNIISLATEPGFRFRPGTSTPQPLLEPPLRTQPELTQLRDDLAKIELYNGTLISTDAHSTVILVGVPPETERTQFYWTVRRLADARSTAANEVAVTGSPAAESLLGSALLEDLGVPTALLGGNSGPALTHHSTGAPNGLHELKLLIAKPFGLVPLAALVMMLVLLLCFGTPMAALVPLPGVAATLVFVFGLMGWFGVPVYLTTAVMPVLLTVISVTNDIYLFNRYLALLRDHPGVSRLELLQQTIDSLARPVAVTSLTAVMGFLSFAFSPVLPIRAFGMFTAAGALFGLFLSLTVVPALLALSKPSWLLAGAHWQKIVAQALSRRLSATARAVVSWRWRIAALGLVLATFTTLGLRKLKVQDSWTSGFAPDSYFSQVTRQINEQFFGMHILLISADAPLTLTGELPPSVVTPQTIAFPVNIVSAPAVLVGSSITLSTAPGTNAQMTTLFAPATLHSRIEATARRGDRLVAWLPSERPDTNFWPQIAGAGRVRFEIQARSHFQPELLRTLGGLASFVRERRGYAVGGVLGPLDYLTTTRFMLHPTSPDARVLHDEPGEVKSLWDYYGAVLGQQRLRQVLDADGSRSLTTVFLKDANFADTARLMQEVRDYERKQLTPRGIKLGFAGDVAVSQSLIRGIVLTQLQSLSWALAGIFAVTAWFGGSVRWGFYCLLPSFLAVLIKFAVMGWLGIPLGVATSMFAAMTLGIGVNCAIHLLEGCSQAHANGASPAEALEHSLRSAGPPALLNTLALSLGFGVLLLSQVPANARLGTLVVLGLVNCFVMSLLALPLLLHWWPLKK